MVDYYSYKMSGSDEEFETQISQGGMSKAELRRSNKPIMEKRRRARINQCLDELKSLILEAMKKDPARHSKLEKADILEMTVKHLQTVQRQQLTTAVATDPAVLTKFRSGFAECATEVSRYVSHLENVDPAVRQRLVSHLNSCVTSLQQMVPFYSHYVPYMPERVFPEVKVGFQSDFHSGDENNNGSARIQIPSGVQLIPSRLPSGELALLVPQSAGISANFPFFPPPPESTSKIGPSSAFTAVHRSQSPLLSPSTSTSSFGEESHHSEHYQQAHSPGQHLFKIPDQSPASSSLKSFSSPETQKAHISSSSDRKSPVSSLTEVKVNVKTVKLGVSVQRGEISETGTVGSSLPATRLPLSVITDRPYNKNSMYTRRETLKRPYSENLLAISEKKSMYYEASSSTASLAVPSSTILTPIPNPDELPISVEDLSNKPSSSAAGPSARADNVGPPQGSSGNGDMWRPW
ncbi:protein hairy [Neodiprion pinetum]|uniref:Protein hairy-like n=1 Tax=Neodiprion lecontei TaxID=441921 RepID=A0A6J0BC96_NEOLC|nr:protein hairy-like [Neodiprion lecontei]XP_046467881.1 protein hairy-like [Neodiprion pinetum]